MKKIITILGIAIFAVSCSNERKEVSITFVFDKPITSTTKYPPYFQEIAMPFTSSTGLDYLLKPINISRLDISNKVVETNAWYFKDMGDNTVEFSKGWLSQYFKDSLINNYLTQVSTKEASIDNWFADNKDTILIYSDDAVCKEFKGRKVYSDAKELNAKIQEITLLNTTTSVVVLINPTITQAAPILDVAAQIKQINDSISALNSPGKQKEKAKETIKTYTSQVEGDPLAMYQLMKTVIYSGDHHEAFEMLEDATRLAIKQGLAVQLYRLIAIDLQNDLNKDISQRTTWRLSTPDHKHHWDPLINALTKNDASLLHKD